ncbi:MAG: hypothetical protein F6J90_27520 [Moorea sp. SIOASIH]|nr:hypothetical protein [Moorena sp. SIOASIH]
MQHHKSDAALWENGAPLPLASCLLPFAFCLLPLATPPFLPTLPTLPTLPIPDSRFPIPASHHLFVTSGC